MIALCPSALIVGISQEPVQVELGGLLFVAFLLGLLRFRGQLFGFWEECLRILVPIIWWLLAFLQGLTLS
jgi:hypothetical protein